MGSKSSKQVTAALATLALAAAPAAAMPAKDYSMNGATGDTVPQVRHQTLVKNYGLNGASGDYAPAVKTQVPALPPAQAVNTVTSDGFSWGAALAGAGTTLLLVLALGATMRIRRRMSGAPRVA
ncbi:MAG: hypothetical protein ACJ77Z_08210 [Thermoleophilaceae bacterium]